MPHPTPPPTSMPVAGIRVGDRHRKSFGDLDGLAASIKSVGLLQPLAVRPDGLLIAGERRLRAVRQLGWKTVPVHVIDGPDDALRLLLQERDENTQRLPFAPSEAVAVGRQLRQLVAEDSRRRQQEGRSRGGKARHGSSVPNLNQADGSGKTRHKVAQAVGMSATTLDQAEEIVAAAEADPERFGELKRQMDASGKVNGVYKRLRAMRAGGGSARKAKAGGEGASAYEPLASVSTAEDPELLESLLAFYPRKPPRRILDATFNRGRFWVGSPRRPALTALDVDPENHPDRCGENADVNFVTGDHAASPFGDGEFDVVVYDPPHVPNRGAERSKDFNERFGLGKDSATRKTRGDDFTGYNLHHQFPPFLAEAARVLKPNGVLICKVIDYVHGHRMQWAHVELLTAARAAGFTPCDCIIQYLPDKSPIRSPAWKTARHSRRHHAYWLVFRRGTRCE